MLLLLLQPLLLLPTSTITVTTTNNNNDNNNTTTTTNNNDNDDNNNNDNNNDDDVDDNKIWICLVPTSTTRFASDVGHRMAKKYRVDIKFLNIEWRTPHQLTNFEDRFGLCASVIF